MKYAPVIINGEETNYLIFEDGYLYNFSNHKNSVGSLKQGYYYYQLTVKGKIIYVPVHKLLAQHFIPTENCENKVVHHKDGNPKNNSLSNLEWVTQKENCNLKINKTITILKSLPLTKEEIDNEHWAPFPLNKNYLISDLGRRKNLSTGQITQGSINKNTGYIRWVFSQENGEKLEIQAHRAVYLAFHPNEELKVINHIDGKRDNNRLVNLENISQQDNVKKAYRFGQKVTKPVAQLDDNYNLIKCYRSMKEACISLGGNRSGQVSSACHSGYKWKNYYWKEITPQEYNDYLENFS